MTGSPKADIDLLRPGQDIDAVVIGASAGALEALQVLIPHLRCTTTTFVIVVHLPADGGDRFVAQFRHLSALPLKLAEDGEAVRPGVIYFAPGGCHLMVGHDEIFELIRGPLVNYSRPSIDVLFESAADTWGRRTAGVILTGANEDGAKGLKEIGKAGGLTLVQDPQDAAAPYMPSVAIRTAQPAAVLSLEALSRLLDAWADEPVADPASASARRSDAV